MSLTDTRRFYALVRRSGTDGLHSHDARRMGISGNPSQRAKDIVSKGFQIWTARESRNGRPGSRYWLDGNQPDHATAVKPNGAGGSGDPGPPTGSPPVAAASNAALVLDFTGAEREAEEILPNGTRVYREAA